LVISTECLDLLLQGGIFVFNLFDSFSAGLSLLFIMFLELIVVAWIYDEWRVFFGKPFYPGQCVILVSVLSWSVACYILKFYCAFYFSPTGYLDVQLNQIH